MLDQLLTPARVSLQRFFKLESAGGLLLIGAAALAIVLANSPGAAMYSQFLALPVTVTVGSIGVDKPLLLWINDGFMAIFFLLVALELKREMLCGQFSDRSQIALPAFCALGGVAVPSLIYAWFNWGDAASMSGWAVPAATDIAFALGILSLLGSRVPLSLKMLLTAIAVLDDLIAIVIIAVFYSDGLALGSLLVALAALVVLIVMNRRGVTKLVPYMLVGTIMWLAVLKSGVHATLAGVVLGMTIPLRDRDNVSITPLETLEHSLHPWVAYAILPLFAFANAGLSLSGITLDSLLAPEPLGIALGLLAGKPIGILAAAGLAILLGMARMPNDISVSQLLGMACLCGIGFTMSLFVGSLAFEHSGADLLTKYRLGILLGSVAAAGLGSAILLLVSRRVNQNGDA